MESLKSPRTLKFYQLIKMSAKSGLFFQQLQDLHHCLVRGSTTHYTKPSTSVTQFKSSSIFSSFQRQAITLYVVR